MQDCAHSAAYAARAWLYMPAAVMLHTPTSRNTEVSVGVIPHFRMKQEIFRRLDDITALTAGHKTRPEGGVLRNYVECIPRDVIHSRHCKTIVNTKHADIAEGCAVHRSGFGIAGLHRGSLLSVLADGQ